MRRFNVFFVCFLLHSSYANTALRGPRRRLQTTPYYETTDLGGANPEAALGNPLKGLLSSPRFGAQYYADQIQPSLEFYYVGLDECMVGDPDQVGVDAAFDWSPLETLLDASAAKNMHGIPRFFIHYPGQPLRVPLYLLEAGVEIRDSGHGPSPYYGDPLLLKALEQFIAGKCYAASRVVNNILERGFEQKRCLANSFHCTLSRCVSTKLW
jgi:hypothetical protein